jgi:outer membrane protein assembly factor BamD
MNGRVALPRLRSSSSRVLSLLLTSAFLMSPGCAAKKAAPARPLSAQELFDQGLAQMRKKDYKRAILSFQKITIEFAATRYASDAQFYLAEAYLGRNDFDQAAIEYEFLTVNYSTSPFYEEALYKTAYCSFRQAPRTSLDQTDLAKTEDLLGLFIERFPESRFLPQVDSLRAEIATRYARKQFDAGLLYARAGEYASAQIYFEYVQQNYPDASIASENTYWLARCLEGQERREAARALYQELVNQCPSPELRAEAARRLSRLGP